MSLILESQQSDFRVYVEQVRDIAPTEGKRLGGGLGIHANSATRLADLRFDVNGAKRQENVYLADCIIMYKKATERYGTEYISIGLPEFFVRKVDEAATRSRHQLDKTKMHLREGHFYTNVSLNNAKSSEDFVRTISSDEDGKFFESTLSPLP